jgi:hypothetical protein
MPEMFPSRASGTPGTSANGPVGGVRGFFLSRHRSLVATNIVILPVLFVATSAALVLLLLSASHTYVSIMLNDTFTILDGAYRFSLGYIPHIDFHTELGFLNLAFPAMGLSLTSNMGTAIPTALALYVAVLSPFAIYVAASRLHYWVAVPFYLYVILMAATPFLIGSTPVQISLAYIYNRLGWVGLLIIFILFMKPLFHQKKTWIFDSITAACIIFFLLYTKINYGLVALASIVLMAILDESWRRSALVGIVLLIAFIGIVEVTLGLNRGYLNDIGALIAIRTMFGGDVSGFLAALMKNVEYVAASILAVVLMCGVYRKAWRYAIFSSYIIFTSILLFMTSSQDENLPAVIAVIVLACELSFREMKENKGEKYWVPPAALFFVFLIMISKPFTYSVAAFALNHIKSTQEQPNARAGNADAADHFYVEDWPIGKNSGRMKEAIERFGEDNFDQIEKYVDTRMVISQQHYFRTIKAGERFLKSFGGASDTVVVFDFANPFSLLLGLKPPTGDQLTYYYGYTFTDDIRPPAETLFRDATLVMIPKTAITPQTRDAMARIYGDYVEARYDRVHDDQYWTVWRKKGSRAENPA